MPNLASIVRRKFLHQLLAVWAKAGSDGFGKPVFADPAELACRWEDKQQELLLPDGRKVLSKGYLLMADLVAVGGMVLLGGLAAWRALSTYPAVPTVLQGGREVVRVDTTPDVKNQSTIYEVYL